MKKKTSILLVHVMKKRWHC